MIKKLIGISMWLILVAGFIVLIGYEMGYKPVLIGFRLTFILVVWMSIATYLLSK